MKGEIKIFKRLFFKQKTPTKPDLDSELIISLLFSLDLFPIHEWYLPPITVDIAGFFHVK